MATLSDLITGDAGKVVPTAVTPEQKASMANRIAQQQGAQLPQGWKLDEESQAPVENKGAQITSELKASNTGLPAGWSFDQEPEQPQQPAAPAPAPTLADKLKQYGDKIVQFAVDSVHPKQESPEESKKAEVGALESAGRAYLSGQHQLGKAAGMLFAGPAVAADYLKNIVGKPGDTSIQDFVFSHWVAPHDAAIQQLAVQPYEKQAFTAKVASGIGGLLADLPYMIASGGASAAPGGAAVATPSATAQAGKVISQGFEAARPLMVKAASDKAEQVLNSGGTKAQAVNSAVTAAMLTGYMMSAPMSVESKLFGRLASGAPLYAATSEAARIVQNAADPNQLYQPFDLENFGVNMATGSVLAASLGHRPQEAQQLTTPHEQAKADAAVLQSGQEIPDADPQRIKNASLVAMMGDNKAVEHAIDSGNQQIIDSMLAVSPRATDALEKIKQKAAEAEPTAMSQAFANAKIKPSEVKEEAPTEAAEAPKFLTPEEVTTKTFTDKAEALGLTPEQSAALAPKHVTDHVTGFERAEEKVPTVQRAQQFAKDTGQSAHFVDADIANLGGLNSFFQNDASKANVVYRGISDIFADEMKKAGSQAVPIRHGGDEISAVVIGGTKDSINTAIENTKARVADYVHEQGLADIEHPKHIGNKMMAGVGLHMGQSEIGPNDTLADIFDRASKGVDASKKGAPFVERRAMPEKTAEEPVQKPEASDKFEKSIKNMEQRLKQKAWGENVLDEMEQNNESPQKTAETFWNKTYPEMPEAGKKLFREQYEAHAGEPLRPEANPLDMIDLGSKVKHLEGTDRGFVALMREANNQFAPKEKIPSKVELIKAEKAANAEKIAEASKAAAHHPENAAPLPTEAQHAAGNYPKGHVNLNGLDITIENPKGSVRTGMAEGKPWQVKMQNPYGYIRKTEGADGDHMDVYLGDHITKDSPAFVIDQIDPKTKRFDEHKIVYGARGFAEAKDIYDAHFADKSGPDRRGAISKMSIDELKTWLKGDTTKPLKYKEPVQETNISAERVQKTEKIEHVEQPKEGITEPEMGITKEEPNAPEAPQAEPPKQKKTAAQAAESVLAARKLYAYPTEAAAISAEKRQRTQGFDEGKVIPHPTEEGKFAVVPADQLKMEQKAEEYGATKQTETPEFKKWFGDSKVVDENGIPLIVYHGTTHDISEFKPRLANPENDFGKAIYMTNSKEDVSSNYAGKGPDLTQRIQILAERIAQDKDWEYDDPRALKLAEKRLHGGAENVMPLYVNMKNPLVIGGKETYMGVREARKFINAVSKYTSEYADHPDISDALSRLSEYYYEGGNASDLIKSARDALVFHEDAKGNLDGNELVRKAIERAGYDGIIDHTVAEKWGSESERKNKMSGVNLDTAHYIVFKPEQVKSAIGNKGTFSKDSANILEQKEEPYNETHQANKAEPDIYEGRELRPGTTEKQKQLGRDAYREILSPYARRAGATVLGSRIAKDFQEQGGSSLHGQEAKTPEDFAVLAQVLRDPRFEKFRIFYTKGDKIVGHDAMTSNDPGSVSVVKKLPGESYNIAEQRTYNDMFDKKERLGADGYWLLHNHPSGRAEPSTADLRLTERIAKELPGFRGHIVIDHNEYTHIDANGGHETFQKEMPEYFSKNAPEIPHDALGTVIKRADDIVNIGKMLEKKDGFFTLIGRSARGEVSAIAEFPRSLLDEGAMKELRLHATLRRFAMQTGAPDVAAVVDRSDILRAEKLVQKGLLLDAVDTNGYSARDYVSPEGRELFQKKKHYEIDQPTAPYGKSRLVRQDEVKPKETVMDKAKHFVGKVKSSLDELKQAYVSPPEFTETKKIIGEYTGKLQEIDYGLSKLAHSINKEFPKDRQEAITNYIQAGGDEAVLRERAAKSPEKFRKGYEDAINLSPKEKELADFIQTQQDDYWKKANEAGIIEHYIDNYVRGQWERENPAGQKIIALVNSGMLNDHPKEAMKKVFQNYAEGEQAGFVPTDKRIGFQFVAGNRSIRAAIAAREALTALMHSTEKDGRPTVAIGGGGSIMEAGAEEKPYFVKPNIKPADAQDYKTIDHPALRGWKWVGSDAEGKPILMHGQMYIHPDAYGKLNALLGKSKVRTYELPKNIPVVGGTRPGEAMLKTGAFIKSTILIGPFHQFHLGEHAVFHGVNPVGVPEINFDERPALREGIYHGLMLYNHNAMHEFAEGLSTGGLWHRLPVVGDGLKRYQEWLFQDYIPRLKAAMFEKALSRAEEEYAEQLRSGKLTRDQLLDNVAKQANAAFGELNYKYMARDPSYQDALRIALLAPDFLEARMKFFAQAVRPYGKEQAMALVRGAAIMALGAQTINMMFGDDKKAHWDRPFSVIIDGREYSPRSVVGDIAHLVEDPRGFWFHRINPLWGRPLYELSTGRNVQGQKETVEEGIENILKSWIPIPAQGIFKEQPELTATQSIVNTMLQSIGVSNFQTKSPAEKMIHDFNFDKMPQVAMTDEQMEKRKVLRAIEAKIRSGEQDKAQQLFQEGQAKHIITGRDYAMVIRRSTRPQIVNAFKHLDYDQAQKVWEVASPEEKKILELAYTEKKIAAVKKNAQLGLNPP